ncbi:hypothetical protein [Asanoa siamensis]|uniref:FXSXX-COOH protein n=1 Tax=Asanoa siamensis TaxID=926357 RepID=A0ABQ4CVG3_9ACTN|nr:hypothetical protein [Asanoa siamensis]GIF75275.1 hypothetical protein Asi02nite_47930 [Asanoa siamensis]
MRLVVGGRPHLKGMNMEHSESLSGTAAHEPAVANLSRVSLEAVFRPGDSVLDSVLSRLLATAGDQGENYAAHGTTPTP